jgi:hypothetical protein
MIEFRRKYFKKHNIGPRPYRTSKTVSSYEQAFDQFKIRPRVPEHRAKKEGPTRCRILDSMRPNHLMDCCEGASWGWKAEAATMRKCSYSWNMWHVWNGVSTILHIFCKIFWQMCINFLANSWKNESYQIFTNICKPHLSLWKLQIFVNEYL